MPKIFQCIFGSGRKGTIQQTTRICVVSESIFFTGTLEYTESLQLYSVFHLSSSPGLTISSNAHKARVKNIFAHRHHTWEL